MDLLLEDPKPISLEGKYGSSTFCFSITDYIGPQCKISEHDF